MRWVSGVCLSPDQLAPALRLLQCVTLSPGLFPAKAKLRTLALGCYSLCAKLFALEYLPEKKLVELVDTCGLSNRPITPKALNRMVSHLYVFTRFRLDLFGGVFQVDP